MLKSYKYRIYPTKSQITKIENTFSICRALYNNALEHRLTEFKRTGRAINYYEQANSLPEIKSMFPWYKSVYSTVLQDVLKRLEKSYQSFFRRMKDSKIKSSEKGYPKFKKKGQWNSITYANGKDIKYPEAVAEYFEPEPIGKYSELKAKSCRSMAIEGCRNNVVSVPKIGDIKIVLHRNIPANGMIKTMSIIKEANKWFVTFSVELNNSYPEPEPKAKNLGEYYELNVNELKSIGIDVGLIDFYYDSNGVNKKAPRLLRLSEKNLKRLQRKLSTCIKRSKEYYKVLK
jgi:putative transposase